MIDIDEREAIACYIGGAFDLEAIALANECGPYDVIAILNHMEWAATAKGTDTWQ